jgi:hypothetical protein
MNLAAAIAKGKEAAAAYVRANPEGPNWYPCGFAWLTYSCRKNAKESKTLLANGFRWDDYHKEYTFGAYEWTSTQSMDYKTDILRAMQTELAKHNFVFGVRSRID